MSSSGTYSQFIGRAGMLAVTLGIGSAIAVPQLAWAEPGAPSDTTTTAEHSQENTSDADSPADSPNPAVDRDQDRDDDAGGIADEGPAADAADPDEPGNEGDPVSTPTGLRKLNLGSPVARSARTADNPALKPSRVAHTQDQAPAAATPRVVGEAATDHAEVAVPVVSGRPTQSTPVTGLRAVVTNLLRTFGFRPESGQTNTPLLEGIWGAYRRIEGSSAKTSGAAPELTASTAVTAAALPAVTAVITSRSPSATRPSSLIRTVVLGVLGIFGFNPNRTNNPVLQGIWNSYRKAESYISNIPPDFTAVHVLGTSIAENGRIAVQLGFDVSDYDGDLFTVFESGVPNLDQNPDGTFTYFAEAGFTGTTQTWVTAVDSGDHFHHFALWDYSGGHYRTAAVTLTFV